MNIELVREIRELVSKEVSQKDIMQVTALRGTDINFIIRMDKILSEDWQKEIKLLNDEISRSKLNIKFQNDNLTLISKLQKDIVSLQNQDLNKKIVLQDEEFRNLEKNYLEEIKDNKIEIKELNRYISKIPNFVKNFLSNE